jgi:L-seryl-tRNA(Ser) seleniumtransferase
MRARRKAISDRPPAMERILSHPGAAPLLARYGREAVKESLRALFREGGGRDIPGLLARCAPALARAHEPEVMRVVNATGVLIHTNLGRAPLVRRAREAAAAAAEGYQAIEFDLETGRRGSRGGKTRARLARLLGVPDALLVNNNAAAVLLALAAAAAGREVLVSRGELPAIGGSFKIPEILEASGARLREVGTTNRTRIEEYDRACSPATAAVLTVHPSNYEIRGYVKRPSFDEVAGFARRRKIPWFHDQGTGNLLDLAPFRMAGEERATDSLRAGADLTTFSGDKLFGGPQAGVLAGNTEWVRRCAAHPLARALRPGKMTLAAFSATLEEWLTDGAGRLPIFELARVPVEELRRRAERIAACPAPRLAAEVVATESLFGGGTTPEKTFPSAGLAIRSDLSAPRLAAMLRARRPPIVGRVEGRRLILDLRAVFPEEDAEIVQALSSL